MRLPETDLLANLLQTSTDGIVVCDGYRRVQAWNPALENFTGLSAAQATGQLLAEVLPNWVGEAWQSALAAVLQGQSQELPMQSIINQQNGRPTLANCTLLPVRAAGDQPLAGCMILAKPVTAAGLPIDAATYQILGYSLEHAPHTAIQIFTPDGIIRYWNQASTELYGLAPEQTVGRRINEVFQFLTNDKSVDGLIELLLRTQKPLPPSEDEVMVNNGRRVWILHSAIPMVIDGQVVGVCCIDVDVTSRRNVEQSLLANQSFTELLLTTMPDFIYTYDLNNRKYEFANSALREILGYSDQDVMSGAVNLEKLIHPADAKLHGETLQKIAASSSDGIFSLEYRQKNIHNEWRWVVDRIRVFRRNNDGTPASIIGSRQDITSLKDAERDVQKLLRYTQVKNRAIQEQNTELALREEALREKNTELEEKSEELLRKRNELVQVVEELQERNFELDQLVYKISHDIRSPLTSILGLVNVIRMDPDPQLTADSLRHMEQSVLRLDGFVKSMLNYAKTNRVETQSQLIDFGAMINQCLSDLTYMDHFDQIKKTVSVTGEVGNFRGDKLRIDIILRNLISNSIKYCKPTGPESFMDVLVHIQPQNCTITVADNGIGIREEYLQKVFDMFFRATEKSDGSGLGLYIVKQTVDKMGGHIDIRSTHGEGTTVVVQLPNHPA
jgi:PAS domain S-box-containing protein